MPQKMHAAQTSGGDIWLGPSQMGQAQIKQRGTIASKATTAGGQEAQAAQAQKPSSEPPPARAGPEGTTTPYPAQNAHRGRHQPRKLDNDLRAKTATRCPPGERSPSILAEFTACAHAI
jgi:hypothetical protein